MNPKRPDATFSSIKEGLVKIARDIQLLKSEVKLVREKLGSFVGQRDLHPAPRTDEIAFGIRPQTRDPDPQIPEMLFEFKHTSNLEVPALAIMAIARDLDGALRDIRSTRADIEAIANDSDLRSEFRNWIKE